MASTTITAHKFIYKNGTSYEFISMEYGCVFSMTDEELDEHA